MLHRFALSKKIPHAKIDEKNNILDKDIYNIIYEINNTIVM